MPLGDVVKGTPFENRTTGPGPEDRLAIMNGLGIDIAELTVNDFWWWEAKDQGLARAICSKHNGTLAAGAEEGANATNPVSWRAIVPARRRERLVKS